MNLTSFIKQVDAYALECSKEQLADFIHDIGRVLPENKRIDFLDKLKKITVQTTSGKASVQKEQGEDLYQIISDNIELIESQELHISAELNEEYDDWYNSDADEFVYEDNDGVGDIIDKACDYVHKCFDEGKYELGYEIGNRLILLDIISENEYEDETLTIADIGAVGLINSDLKRLLLDTLICTYYTTEIQERPEAIMSVIESINDKEIKLEDIIQHNDSDLPLFNDFLNDLIIYLGNRTGWNCDRFYSEAVLLIDNLQTECKYAEQFVGFHPSTYLEIIHSLDTMDYDNKISVGLEAIDKIPVKYVYRSKVAQETVYCIKKSNIHTEMLDKCSRAIYESDTSAVNYLAAINNGYSGKRDELRDLYTKLIVNNNRPYRGSEREENVLNPNESKILKFLDGQFEEVLDKGLNTTAALGWSSTFMKQGIALFLTAMYNGTNKPQGISRMFINAKNAVGYIDEIIFNSYYSVWKEMTPMDEKMKLKAIQKIEKKIEMRTEGIMNGNKRNYYGECASFIAACGEVRESWGDIGAKQRIMTEYKNKYNRRSAFRAELQAYGWIG